MDRKLITLALAAVVGGASLVGCGGSTRGAASPSSAELNAALMASTQEAEPDAKMDDEHDREAATSTFVALLDDLRQVPQLAPLFDLYRIPNPVVVQDDEVSAGLIQLLRAVKITISTGTVTISNRATGGVIFSAPQQDLASGVFDAQNLPGAMAPPSGVTCTSFTYSDWGACQNGTQTRTVLTSSPAGCTGGTPVTTQACTSTPPPAPTCTAFTYSPWGACQPDGTQTRTVVTSLPAGCTGGTPATTQACTYTAPPDGVALYGSSCAGCHGPLATSNLKGKGISLSLIKSMNMTQGLTDAQLQAIVTAVGP